MLLGLHLEFLEDVAPKSLHVVPVGHDTVFNWVVQFQDALVFVLFKIKIRLIEYGEVLTAASPMNVSCSF